jgi:DNA repair photolyase
VKKIANPPNPFHSEQRELLEPAPDAKLSVYEDTSRSILTANDSPDVGFTWSLNAYRGCFHSCAYCYARRYHEYLDMGAGTDFESKIAIKKDAPVLLRKELSKKSWKFEPIVFSGATDCYQPLEAVYKLTQQCLEVCLEFRNPICIITKGFLVTRDADLLVKLHKEAGVSVVISIPFASDDMARKIEPQASTVKRRFEAIKILSEKGIPVGVSLAPTIPGLNDNDIPLIMKKAKESGARYAFHSIVRLSGSVQNVFEEKIRAALPPERVERILNRIRDSKHGKLNDSRWGHRMKGDGNYWKSISDLYHLSQKKYGLTDFPEMDAPVDRPKRVSPSPQLELGI